MMVSINLVIRHELCFWNSFSWGLDNLCITLKNFTQMLLLYLHVCVWLNIILCTSCNMLY